MLVLIFVLLVLLIFILFVYFKPDNQEHFYWDDVYWYRPAASNCKKNLFDEVECLPERYDNLAYAYPFSYPLRHTKYMTYDIRGEPIIPKRYFVWNNSDVTPYWYN